MVTVVDPGNNELPYLELHYLDLSKHQLPLALNVEVHFLSILFGNIQSRCSNFKGDQLSKLVDPQSMLLKLLVEFLLDIVGSL